MDTIIRATLERPAGGGKQRLLRLAMRYGLSSFGPVVVSGAHFVVSFLFLHAFSRAQFGLFSFLLVVVPFSLSMNGALLGISITSLGRDRATPAQTATHMKASLLFAAATAICVASLLWVVHAALVLAAALGAYGAIMTMRWFARSFSYSQHKPLRVVASDIAYSVIVTGAASALFVMHRLTVPAAALALLGAAALSLLPFGPDYLDRQFRPGSEGSLRAYRSIWREMTRWSFLGVVLTEMTANAHVYLVTLISGSGAFALLAVGALLMRPVSLVYAALPDLERPAMARAISAGNFDHAFRIVKEFRTAVRAMWLVTVLLAGLVLAVFPHLVLKNGYSSHDARVVAALFAVIMLLRAIRTPESVLLQAAGVFRPLAQASVWSSITSILATLVLLFVGGPIVSLGGIIAGEFIMAANVLTLASRWKRSHG